MCLKRHISIGDAGGRHTLMEALCMICIKLFLPASSVFALGSSGAGFNQRVLNALIWALSAC